jgi:hypothetical protein
MAGWQGFSRWAVAAVAVVMLASASFSDVGAVDEGVEHAPRFTDGSWGGEVIYSVNAKIPGGAAQAILDSATFELQVTGGSVAGTLHAVGEGTAIVGTDAGTAAVSFDGSFGGDAAHPAFTQEHFEMSGNAVVSGMPYPIDVDFGGTGQTVVFEIANASCDAVGGSFEQPVAAVLASAGATPTSLTAYWFAIRHSDATASADEPLKQLMDTASQLLTAFQQDGTLDPTALFELVKSAENFSASLQKNTACGLVDDPVTFSVAITGIVTQMLRLAFGPEYASKFDTTQLADLVYAGIATGAIGPGAVNQATSEEILAAAKPVFADRLDQAIKGGFKSGIEDVLEIAIAVPWPDLAADAQTALAKLK